ncbi:sigma-70 family RNA polymerase sigma factor [Luteolibacter sp. LG18]|uniref:sigma-70 family RNA polymerase sigma factor n=1 Tax=Luteolibacter sp. LG18 TaxID=2819286 RepID=UPI002B30D9FB|nr:DNA-directed RNA polymerase sigma-70 factor [Luteolibacter sp. LG18]
MTIPFPAPGEPPRLSEEEFHQLLAASQPRLKGYVASILGGWSDVDDIVQETNLVLLQKQGVFEAGTNFISWAFRVAYFKATTWRRDRQREGRVVFSEHAFQELAAHAEERFHNRGNPGEALAECLKRLPAQERELVEVKYAQRRSLVDHARTLGCSAQSLHKRISRIRLALRECMRRQSHSELS